MTPVGKFMGEDIMEQEDDDVDWNIPSEWGDSWWKQRVGMGSSVIGCSSYTGLG